jgi:hypothetical protein
LILTRYIVQALVLNTDEGWRWCYSINAVFSIAATILLLGCYRPPTSAQLKQSSPPEHRLDKKEWLRTVVFAFATALATYGLLWGDTVFGEPHGMNSSQNPSDRSIAWRFAGVITLITVSGLILIVHGISTDRYPPKYCSLTDTSIAGIQGANPQSGHGRLFRNIRAMVQIAIASGSSLILYFMPSTVELVLQIIIGETGMKAAWNQVRT